MDQGTSRQQDLEDLAVKSTITTAKIGTEMSTESRLEKDIEKMLEKEKTVPVGRKQEKKKEMSEIGKKKRFAFQTRGKINAKESKELKGTHNNIFEWVKKQKKIVEETDSFEKNVELEVEIEPIEIDVMSKQDRLSRMRMMRKAWEAGRICKGIIIELAEGMEKAVTRRMVGELAVEISN